MARPVLAFTRRLPIAVEEEATRRYNLKVNAIDAPWTPDDWRKCGSDAIVCTVTDQLTAQIIGILPCSVRLVANFGVGVSHIDLAAAANRGITVTNTPDVLTDATADIALLLILGAARRAGEGDALMRTRTWTGWAPTAMLGVDLAGKTLGILGMGRIGTALARRARALGMNIVYHARRPCHSLDFEAEFIASPAEFWPRCNVLSLHAPLTDATRDLIDAGVIAQLPANAIVVNTARGELIDDEALVAALATGRVAAAGLDVFRGEPKFDPRYSALPNTFLLPHLGSATVETRTAMGCRALANVDAFFAGQLPPDRVA